MEPRSVVLEKEKKKKTKKEKKVQGEKENMEILATEPFPGGLLQAIASFLQRHGFSKSLSAFNSEAHIEVDSLATDALEAIYSKHVKNRCENPNDGTSGVLKNGDSRAGTETTKDDFVASEETHKKKRKRCSDDENTISNSDIPNMGNDTAPPVDESSQPKEKKKKKKKNKLSANGGIVVDAEHNKEKLKAETLENSGLLKKVDTSDVPQSLEQSIEEPKRKKRKDKATASPEEDTLQDNGNKSQEKVNDLAINKKSEAVSNGSGYENERVQAKEKKKTKKDAPDNSTLVESEHGSLLNAQQHSLDKLDGGSDLGKVEKHDLLKSDNAEQKKIKRKKEKIKHLIDEAKLSPEGARGDAKSDKAVVTTVQKQTEGAENGSEKDQTNGLPKLTEVNDDGTGEEKGHSGNSITKITKKDSKHSAEPKTVNAFQRVNPDEVRFADERLQDNSYWAKGGADTGYGAKAQEVLGQVRGKGFRHEKTKKKRGSYRGGQIDLQSHSIKFNYSDEE